MQRCTSHLPFPDARAMKEDFILWPPLVIVHNANGEMKKDGSKHVISNLDMDEILQGLGFNNGKIKVVNGSSVIQGTLLVKFSPNFMGYWRLNDCINIVKTTIVEGMIGFKFNPYIKSNKIF
jgi:hypothetical protein